MCIGGHHAVMFQTHRQFCLHVVSGQMKALATALQLHSQLSRLLSWVTALHAM